MAEKNVQPKTVAVVAGVVAAILLVAAFFLPYASATEEYRAALGMLSQNPFGLENGELADVSLFEYVRIYLNAASETFAAVYVPLTVAPAVLGVLTVFFAALRKPIPSIAFSVLTVAVTFLLNWDFEDRGVIPSDSYDWGIAKWVYLVAGVAVIACAVWQIVLRRKAKRA
ncbi:hypothetical protein H6A07_05155 [Olsenella uli]|uniref:hypothetical protein n=1 Tax=Olsenella uli TaxID=133926 RepID=UPI001958D17B|nr:hypothetical protein [Olsenella uli]MBM6676126.1 hypothetical protein [Olsenella uli]